MTTPAEHAATVREALDKLEREERLLDGWNFDPKVVAARCAALDALEAQADQIAGLSRLLERTVAERDRLREKLTAESGYCGEVLSERDQLADDLRLSREAHWADRAKLAARVEKLEAEYLEYREANRHGIASLMQERDRLREAKDRLITNNRALLDERHGLRARVEELEAALREACDDLAQIIPTLGQTAFSLQAEANLRHYRAALDKETA